MAKSAGKSATRKAQQARAKARPSARQTVGTVVHLRDLKDDPNNAREHTARNIGLIAESLQQTGAGRSVVVDEDLMLLGGHGVKEACAEVGITKVRIIDADGDELIAVRRSGLTAQQKIKLALYDNRAGEFSRWNPDVLAQIQDAGVTLTPMFTEEELQAILSAPPPPEMEEDDARRNAEQEPPESFQTVDENLPTEHECPKCHYKWSGGR